MDLFKEWRVSVVVSSVRDAEPFLDALLCWYWLLPPSRVSKLIFCRCWGEEEALDVGEVRYSKPPVPADFMGEVDGENEVPDAGNTTGDSLALACGDDGGVLLHELVYSLLALLLLRKSLAQLLLVILLLAQRSSSFSSSPSSSLARFSLFLCKR